MTTPAERRPWVLPLGILWAILLVPAVILAPFVVFLWDDPAANDRVWWIAIPWLLLPVAFLLSIIGMWLFRRHGKTAALFALLPIFDIVALVVASNLAA